MLNIEKLEIHYGAIPAVSGLDLSVRRGELVALLGANGAGKSTTLNTIAGLHRPTSGRVTFEDRDITGWPAHRVVRNGLALVPEGRMVVGTLTVEENLGLSAYARGRSRKADLAEVYRMFPRLEERRRQTASLMSGGEQQMLAIARALMTKPSMLLLDEPSMGLAPSLVDVVFDAIRAIRQTGLTVLLVEQNAAIALPLADRVVLLDRGAVVTEGSPEELERNPEMLASYLGLDTALAFSADDAA